LSDQHSTSPPLRDAKWQFWIDRGGTFTDIVARRPDGRLVTHKLLSENPQHYDDAAIAGICAVLEVDDPAQLREAPIGAVKMGTTVATNALLERTGDRTLLLTTRGFADALRIGYQNRPHLFDREIELPALLYERVAEVGGRFNAQGVELEPFDVEGAKASLEQARTAGINSVAIVFMHGYRHTAHETAAAALARSAGYTQVSVSHEVSPLMKLVGRGDTTVVDAYLSPILRRYVDQVAGALHGCQLMFMRSSGGLTDAKLFQGKDSILSGPAGGIVGAVRTSAMAGFERIIGFDMGGTSTDVSHYAGEYERAFNTLVAGVRMRVPTMRIHTVAAGGGSILHFDGERYRVGPDSAGAAPGPACYRRGGPLTVTDCNVMLGKLHPDFFPAVFGPSGTQTLDTTVVSNKFEALAADISVATGAAAQPHQVAEGFLTIAVQNMANAIKTISVQRGYDVTRYTLTCFGGAGGQHACLVADALGIERIFIHPYAGVLSAYGMGLADIRAMREQAIEAELDKCCLQSIAAQLGELEEAATLELLGQGLSQDELRLEQRLSLRYSGTDSALEIPFGTLDGVIAAFEAAYRGRYGFTMPDRVLIVEAVRVEAIGQSAQVNDPEYPEASPTSTPEPEQSVAMHCAGAWQDGPVYQRDKLLPGHVVAGPAIICESTGTNVLEPGWAGRINRHKHLILERVTSRPKRTAVGTSADPVMLEVFNNLFMSIAEQMGAALENTAYSVNIKERLDFSCALFDAQGRLIANAPHMPVHLGSMGESVQTLMRKRGTSMRGGEVYVLNDPYNGGTHLPDVTVVTPLFDDAGEDILFYVASRGHHADIGGTTPGSMPPDSKHIDDEGVLIDNMVLVENGHLREEQIRAVLAQGRYPARNPDQNIADLRAQIAANEKGVQELRRMMEHFGLPVVNAYMGHVQDNARGAVKRVLGTLDDGEFEYPMDDGAVIRVSVRVDREAATARLDFTGTSAQRNSNFNVPFAVTRAAVLYVFRTLVDDDIPMNDGCLEPLDIHVPEGCMLNPRYPAAVVAGNVETSQAITDTLYGALKVMAASQGTMNNFTFGNETHQYYETICGGSGAGPGFHGTDAVHTHMTNSRLTDPEVLEWRFPVRLELFEIRRGSGGSGTFRGGDGARRRVRFLEAMQASILSGHRRIAPYGMAGGAPGATGRNWVEHADGTVTELGGADGCAVGAGDVFAIETPGGGGYGAG
jgi:5-oxoprolinase (ATP-hydrolysing)